MPPLDAISRPRPPEGRQVGSRRRGRSVAMAVMAALALTLSACGASDDGLPPEETTASGQFGGPYFLTEAVLDDVDRPDLVGLVFDFDADFGDLGIETPCGRMLGSYSLLADGRAGVTITGGTSTACSEAQAAADEDLRAALALIDSWESADQSLTLASGTGQNQIKLAP